MKLPVLLQAGSHHPFRMLLCTFGVLQIVQSSLYVAFTARKADLPILISGTIDALCLSAFPIQLSVNQWLSFSNSVFQELSVSRTFLSRMNEQWRYDVV